MHLPAKLFTNLFAHSQNKVYLVHVVFIAIAVQTCCRIEDVFREQGLNIFLIKRLVTEQYHVKLKQAFSVYLLFKVFRLAGHVDGSAWFSR